MRRPIAGGRAGVALAALALGLGVAGCGADDEAAPPPAARPSADAPPQTTTVQVVEGIGGRGGFNPAELYRRLSPGVVTVISIFENGAGPREDEGGLGSGFVVDGTGHVATNAHVVTTGEGPDTKSARDVYVEFADGNRVPARVVGADPNADVGLLKLEPRGLSLTPLPIGSSRRLVPGQPVAAIGSPFGEPQSLSVGVISAVNRDIESLTAFRIGNAIQTDAAINRGNSGGPLLDARGRVIGINAQIRPSGGGGSGVGFAVPADTVRRSLERLRKDGRVAYAFLGITSQKLYPQLADRLGVDADSGAVVTRVEKGSPAERAGLQAGDDKFEFQGDEDIPKGGDVIVALDGRGFGGLDDLPDLIALRDPGEEIALDVVREGRRRTVRVKLAERPNRAN